MITKRKARRKSKAQPDGGYFIQLPFWLLDSTQYRALSQRAKVALFVVRRHFKGTNNGQIVLSGTMAGEAMGASQVTAWRALDEAVERGFLIVTKEVEFGSGLAREYAITWEPRDGNPATKDFYNIALPKKAARKPANRKPAKKAAARSQPKIVFPIHR